MDLQSKYNSYWESWRESERKFYKNLKPTPLELQQKDLQSRLLLANQCKEEGNLLFKQQNFTQAAEKYLSAIQQVPESQFDFYLREDYQKLKLAIMSNLSMCFLKTKQYPLAILQSKEGLKQFPGNVKLRYVLGCALGESDELEECLQVLNDARELDPANKDVREKLVFYKTAFLEYKKRMKEMFGGKLQTVEKEEVKKMDEACTEPMAVMQKDNSSMIPKVVFGLGILTLGFFLGKKLLSAHS